MRIIVSLLDLLNNLKKKKKKKKKKKTSWLDCFICEVIVC